MSDVDPDSPTPARRRTPVTFAVAWPACISCGACVAVCLQRHPFTSAFDTIAVDQACDIACMRCVDICPTSAVSVAGPGGAAPPPSWTA